MDDIRQKIDNLNLNKEQRELFFSLCSILLDNLELFEGMLKSHPVICNGINYGCISAITLRNRACTAHKLSSPAVQVELMSKNGCVVIAAPHKVKTVKLNSP